MNGQFVSRKAQVYVGGFWKKAIKLLKTFNSHVTSKNLLLQTDNIKPMFNGCNNISFRCKLRTKG